MKKIVTGSQMQLLDRNTSEHFHVPTVVLMEQASIGFVRELLSLPEHFYNILVVCGTGNNAADGIAIARLLNQQGIQTSILLAGEDPLSPKRGSDLYELQKKIFREYSYPIIQSEDSWESYDLLIDAVFGIGLSRDITGRYAAIIERIHSFSGKIVSVDIASGISADTGAVCGIAVRCDYTITFSFRKTGHYLWPGNEYTGKLIVCPMGITWESALGMRPALLSLEPGDLPRLLPARKPHSNKGSYGRLLIVGGSPNMAGAAIFSASAAYACGVGLVRVLTEESNRIILQTAVPEAVLKTYAAEDSDFNFVKEDIRWADAVVIGPGLGTSDTALALLSAIIENIGDTPLLIDADGLNLLAAHPQLFASLAGHPVVITPHLGEMSRLTGQPVSEIAVNLIPVCADFADQNQITCVLKDFRTVICIPQGNHYLNLSGNDGMAAAGSGDVLTGIIGCLLAQKVPVEFAASAGAYLHGLAGDSAMEFTGRRSMKASDLVEGLRTLFLKNGDFS